MASRQIVLDTETTGLETNQGHRIIEIGCVELIDRKLTHNHFHQYINPDRSIDEGAFEVHGISNEFLADKPRFDQIKDTFLDFIRDSELIIHNAAFDVGFIEHEFGLTGDQTFKIDRVCTVLDTLTLARQKHPGQKNSLDALCRRYEVDNSHRDLHGALLDAEILADVYLMMTGGQTALSFEAQQDEGQPSISLAALKPILKKAKLQVIQADEAELAAHQSVLDKIAQSRGQAALWQRWEEAD